MVRFRPRAFQAEPSEKQTKTVSEGQVLELSTPMEAIPMSAESVMRTTAAKRVPRSARTGTPLPDQSKGMVYQPGHSAVTPPFRVKVYASEGSKSVTRSISAVQGPGRNTRSALGRPRP